MITLDKIRKEIAETLEHGCMTSQCVADLMALYYLEDKLGGSASEHYGHMDMETARDWTRHMHNADGSSGEHWTYEQTSKVLRDKGLDCSPAEFYAAINMMWSDYAKVAEKFGVNTVDFWSAMAAAFLDDKDAAPGKLLRYYEAIPQK